MKAQTKAVSELRKQMILLNHAFFELEEAAGKDSGDFLGKLQAVRDCSGNVVHCTNEIEFNN